MKAFFSTRGLFICSIIIVVITNIVVLLGVSSNRSGDPETLIELTERELQMPYRIQKENSGLSLQLVWRSLSKNEDNLYYSNRGEPAWLNVEKLNSIGFNIEDKIISHDDYRKHMQLLSKEVYIVLEYNGASYKESVKRAERAFHESQKSIKSNSTSKFEMDKHKRLDKKLKNERMYNSRLFAIDIGHDAKGLRTKYSDRSRYIITMGLVTLSYDYGVKKLLGRISGLSIENIHIPIKNREIFEPFIASNNHNQYGEPNFRVIK